MKTINNIEENILQRILFVIIDDGKVDIENEIAEMNELSRTAQGEIVLTVTQKKQLSSSETVVGSGKIKEIGALVKTENIDIVLFYQQLTPSQHEAIQDLVDCVVIDRTNLILDIFALHAKTAEGKLQVELAQLNYLLPRLRSAKGSLSRQGAGIGTRGPGETKLETDRRRIYGRINKLKSDLNNLKKQRNVVRQSRTKNSIPTIALVGYTNVGKSTLFNALTQSDVLVENKLFATLDTTAHRLILPNGVNVILTDTVGFIKNLPHSIVEAFKATLEEAVNADIIINVCDASREQNEIDSQISVAEEILNELGTTAPIICVFNKIDKVTSYDSNLYSGIFISSLNKLNFNVLFDKIIELLSNYYVSVKLAVNYSELSVLSLIQKNSTSYEIEYGDQCVNIMVTLPKKYYSKIERFVVAQ